MGQDLLEEMIEMYHPDLFKETQTEEFKISDQILQYRVGHGIAIEEIANYLGLKIEVYHGFEYGTVEVDVSVYQEVFEKLKEFHTSSVEDIYY